MKKSLFVRILLIIGKSILAFIAAILLYLGIEFCLSRITVDAEEGQASEMSIYIINNGVHTDIVMPIKSNVFDWTTLLDYNLTLGKDSAMQYVAMGWGDKGFYLETETWADLKPRVAINAAFGWSTTAMHVTYYKSMKVAEHVRKIDLSYDQYSRLVKYICNTFQYNDNKQLIYVPTDKQYGANDVFYDANGSYSMLHTCNTWANNALKAAGLKACKWTAFYKGIFLKYPLPANP